MLHALLAVSLVVLASDPPPPSKASAGSQPARSHEEGPKSIADLTRGLSRSEGFLPFYWDARKGRLLLEIDHLGEEFLYIAWLATGVGSNDLGLDRGLPGPTRVVRFERYGPKVLLVQQNYAYRALTSNVHERRAAEEAFARSVLWGFDVEAEGPEGRVLVDATRFFLRDAADVAGAIKRAKGGSYQLDASRTAFYLPRTKNFPRNTDVEVLLTFTGEPTPGVLPPVTPDASAVSVQVHHMLVHAPEPGYKPRVLDPRAGYFFTEFMDFASPLGAPLTKRLIIRHRLEKRDPAASQSPPVRPIVYYVDRGAPEPIRSALIEGARWWNQAFEAAGYENAFQVSVLPEDADPLDVRYNVIEWVHRSTRGWAFGNAIADPRTGEIIKGHVTMDSQRARQDYRLLESLLADYEQGKPVDPRIERTVLARMRQLAAHEVGHTLGLAHNFAASATGRASVMDYPPPLVRLDREGGFDVSQAYATGIGAWDRVAIAYGYQDFGKAADEPKALNDILSHSLREGLVFITDEDARPPSSAHPRAHLWDAGPDAVEELQTVFQVRKRALERLSEKHVPLGQPISTLEQQLVLVYLYHRYQAEAAAKVLGGLDYTYAVRGDGQTATDMVPPAQQRLALTLLVNTLKPEFLTLPEAILRMLPPPAYGHPRTREDFGGRTSPTFDALAAAETAADLTLRLLLDPARASRLVEYHARDARNPGLGEVIEEILSTTWKAPGQAGSAAEVQRAVREVALYRLLALATAAEAAPQARALAFLKAQELERWISDQLRARLEEDRRAQFVFAQARLRRFLREPTQPIPTRPIEAPPGQPIGCEP